MPSALATSRSSGVVMKPWIRLASAPKYVVLTVTTAFCSSGYWRTLSSVYERMPSSRMNRLTTIASTGFLMKRSVNFIGSSGFPGGGGRSGGGWNRAVPGPRSAVGRLRVFVGGGLDFVVDGHRGIVAQAQQATVDHGLARLQPAGDDDHVAAGGAGGHEALADDQVGAFGLVRIACGTGVAFLCGHDDEHHVAVRVEGDRGLRDHHHVLVLAH